MGAPIGQNSQGTSNNQITCLGGKRKRKAENQFKPNKRIGSIERPSFADLAQSSCSQRLNGQTLQGSYQRVHKKESHLESSSDNQLAYKILHGRQGVDKLLSLSLEAARLRNYGPLTFVLGQFNKMPFEKVKDLYEQGYRYPPILARLGLYYLNLNDQDTAERFLDAALRDKSYKPSLQDLSSAIEVKFKKGRWSEVSILYNKSLKTCTHLSSDALAYVAYVKLELNDLSIQSNLYRQVISRASGKGFITIEILRTLALKVANQLNDYKLLELLLNFYSNPAEECQILYNEGYCYPPILLRLASKSIDLGNLTKAEEYLDTALDKL